jgi:hypothetical protein
MRLEDTHTNHETSDKRLNAVICEGLLCGIATAVGPIRARRGSRCKRLTYKFSSHIVCSFVLLGGSV